MKESQILVIGMILVSVAVGIYFHPLMPERMAFHWNLEGRVDGYVSKFWGLSFGPLLSIGIYLLFLGIPRIDPMKENIEKLGKYYDGLTVALILFLFYLHLLTLSWNLALQFGMIQALAPALGFLFYYLGVVTDHVRMNWFIGIRTPWTLNNEVVWRKTHKIGAKLFKACGVIAFLGIIFDQIALYLIVLPVILVAIYTTVYSYFEYQRQVKV